MIIVQESPWWLKSELSELILVAIPGLVLALLALQYTYIKEGGELKVGQAGCWSCFGALKMCNKLGWLLSNIPTNSRFLQHTLCCCVVA